LLQREKHEKLCYVIAESLNTILTVKKYGRTALSYTVTEKGTVTIPAQIRRKYKLRTGSKVRFIETEHGALLLPAPSMEELRGIMSKEVGYKIINRINTERRAEASNDES